MRTPNLGNLIVVYKSDLLNVLIHNEVNSGFFFYITHLEFSLTLNCWFCHKRCIWYQNFLDFKTTDRLESIDYGKLVTNSVIEIIFVKKYTFLLLEILIN